MVSGWPTRPSSSPAPVLQKLTPTIQDSFPTQPVSYLPPGPSSPQSSCSKHQPALETRLSTNPLSSKFGDLEGKHRPRPLFRPPRLELPLRHDQRVHEEPHPPKDRWRRGSRSRRCVFLRWCRSSVERGELLVDSPRRSPQSRLSVFFPAFFPLLITPSPYILPF